MTNFLYNPDRKNKKQFIEEFVVRTAILDDIMSDIKSSDMTKPEQHYLLVGQRGTGKTTLLLRLKYAVEDSKKLSNWLIPVIFNEEQYNITELANLWEQIALFLEDYHGFSGLHERMEKNFDKKNFEEICYDILEEALKERGKKLLILIDNIGDLLKKLEDNEVRRLREILQTKKYLRLVAGSPFYLDSILDYTQPLFEFFKVVRLNGLSKEESEKLLLKLGDVHGEKEKIIQIIKDTPERIETLRILTGGVPRTLGLMFQIFIDHEHESSLKDLERILDAVTPLYKHRMDDLPTQQQKIIDAVARNWNAISVKELKTKVRMESKVISAQLRQLEKNQIIEKRSTNTKNHLYILKERFWNIWYLMRYGRKTDNERVIWLVRFLESWCSVSDFEKRINGYLTQLGEGKMNEETAFFYAEVYASLENITSNLKYQLKKNIPKEIGKKIRLAEEEMVIIFEKNCGLKKHEDAIRAMIDSDTLSYKSKMAFDSYLSKFSHKEILDISLGLLKQLGTDVELSSDGGVIYCLFLLTQTLSFRLTTNDIEKSINILDSIYEVITNKKTNLNYEYIFLSKVIAHLLFEKKFAMAQNFFERLDMIDLKDKIKPVYYALIFLAEGSSSERLKPFGTEAIEASKSLISGIQKYWKSKKKKLGKDDG